MQSQSGHHQARPAAASPTAPDGHRQDLDEAIDQLQALACGRLFGLSSTLAGIAAHARPQVQADLLDVIDEVDDMSRDLRAIVAKLRHEGC